MEIRTKSTNIRSILKLTPTDNIEIAFSLNPVEIIAEHEKLTSTLEKRVEAINTLIES
jgi:DNA repair photolyase